jgi:putative membrane protein
MRKATRMKILGALLACTSPFAAQAAAPMPDSAQAFVTKAAQAGLAEVELSKLAGMASRNEAVKNFAARMVTDHQKANMELTAIAKPKSLMVPTQLDAEHAKAVKGLQGKSGEAFDAAYAMHMAMDHDKAVALFESNSHNTDTDLAAFAGKTLPVLQEHKRLANELNAKVNKK